MNRKNLLIAIVAILAFAWTARLEAATLYWDVSDDPGLQVGDGTWDSGTNWNTDAAGNTLPRVGWIDGSDAQFAGQNQTITINGNVQVNRLLMRNPGTTNNVVALTGPGSIELVGDGVIDTVTTTSSSPRFTINTKVTGGNGLTKIGGQHLTLNNSSNDYIGPTTILAGGLQVGTNSLPSTTILQQYSSGVVNLAGDQTIAGLEGTGNIRPTGGPRTLSVGAGDVSTSFDGAIQIGTHRIHVNKIGAGTLVLNGNNGTGNITVNGGRLVMNGDTTQQFASDTATVIDGTLEVNGSITHDTVVQSGGTLAGSGTIGGDVVVFGGAVAPGSSAGTLTIDGDLSFLTSGLVQMEIGGLNQDLIDVGGDVTLNDTTLELSPLAGDSLAAGLTPILAYGGTLNGTFAAVIDNLSSGNLVLVGIDYGDLIPGMISLQLAIIPEPGSALLLAGMCVAVGVRRRRRR